MNVVLRSTWRKGGSWHVGSEWPANDAFYLTLCGRLVLKASSSQASQLKHPLCKACRRRFDDKAFEHFLRASKEQAAAEATP